MIVLDTNVLSEVLRPVPDMRVLNWLRGQTQAALFTTVISRSEMLYGVLLLPQGSRRAMLQKEVDAVFSVDMAGRALDYDRDAAAPTRRSPPPAAPMADGTTTPFDAMIAGIARSRGASLATSNVRDFSDCGITVIDPWSA